MARSISARVVGSIQRGRVKFWRSERIRFAMRKRLRGWERGILVFMLRGVWRFGRRSRHQRCEWDRQIHADPTPS